MFGYVVRCFSRTGEIRPAASALTPGSRVSQFSTASRIVGTSTLRQAGPKDDDHCRPGRIPRIHHAGPHKWARRNGTSELAAACFPMSRLGAEFFQVRNARRRVINGLAPMRTAPNKPNEELATSSRPNDRNSDSIFRHLDFSAHRLSHL